MYLKTSKTNFSKWYLTKESESKSSSYSKATWYESKVKDTNLEQQLTQKANEKRASFTWKPLASSETFTPVLEFCWLLGSVLRMFRHLLQRNILFLGALYLLPHDTIFAKWFVKWHLLPSKDKRSKKEICLSKEKSFQFIFLSMQRPLKSW